MPSLDTTIYEKSFLVIIGNDQHIECQCGTQSYLQELVEPAICGVQGAATSMQQHRGHIRQVHFGNLDRVSIATFGGHSWHDEIVQAQHEQTLLDALQGTLVGRICSGEWCDQADRLKTLSQYLSVVAFWPPPTPFDCRW